MEIPETRGPLSESLVEHLLDSTDELQAPAAPSVDPLVDEDLQLSLYLIHELSYRGLEGVGDDREWLPSLIGFRSSLLRVLNDRPAAAGRSGGSPGCPAPAKTGGRERLPVPRAHPDAAPPDRTTRRSMEAAAGPDPLYTPDSQRLPMSP